MLPGMTPKNLLKEGYIIKAASLEELAQQLGIGAAGLKETVERFNQFAREGHDRDFGRGENAYDRYYGDPTVKPNPCLAPLTEAPFYAVKMWPGDLGTKGGLVTDEHARVLLSGGETIGSFNAARLKEAGKDVTLLAKGRRLADLREHGVVLEDARTGRRTTTQVH
jgi:3-oxosteroid 1-dehydrogenase